jgi:hypothetical protein
LKQKSKTPQRDESERERERERERMVKGNNDDFGLFQTDFGAKFVSLSIELKSFIESKSGCNEGREGS